MKCNFTKHQRHVASPWRCNFTKFHRNVITNFVGFRLRGSLKQSQNNNADEINEDAFLDAEFHSCVRWKRAKFATFFVFLCAVIYSVYHVHSHLRTKLIKHSTKNVGKSDADQRRFKKTRKTSPGDPQSFANLLGTLHEGSEMPARHIRDVEKFLWIRTRQVSPHLNFI